MSEACRLRRLSIAELRKTTPTPTTILVMANMPRYIGNSLRPASRFLKVLADPCEDNLHDVARLMLRFIDGRESSPCIL